MRAARPALPPTIWICAALLICAALYAPGLSGSFLFDDFPNIVENGAVHAGTAEWGGWWNAAMASPSAELRRPLAMLSFAANYWFTGAAPLPMKLSNLAIHLLNGWLTWLVLGKILLLCSPAQRGGMTERQARTAALVVAALWMLSPINLSAVLYVVQRMESLAQLFVLAGLWLYLRGRQAMLSSGGGLGLAVAGLLAGTVLGAMCKESAVLLPLYAFLLEATVLRFGAARPADRRALCLAYAALLLLPAVAGLAWLLPRSLGAQAYAGRPFTLEQRLLTECRVLVRYMGWTLFPRPDQLGFYHDDIALSHGWGDPPSTAGCAALIGAALAAASLMRRRIPLLCLGMLWFFAAHLLTATIIPLELVFEHRNYFASLGLLLAAAGLALQIPPRLRLLRIVLPASALALFGAVLALRAWEWGDPIRFAYAEAGEHPLSPRANYELGRTLAIASRYRPDSKLIDPALDAFERASHLPAAGASPFAAMIVVASHSHRPVAEQWWLNLTDRLTREPPSVDDVRALRTLMECQRKGECPPQIQQLLAAFVAALGHGTPGDQLLGNYGAFAANALGDYPLAARVLAEAAAQSPAVPDYRMDLVKVLILQQDFAGAQRELARLDQLPLSPAHRAYAQELQHQIDAGQRGPR